LASLYDRNAGATICNADRSALTQTSGFLPSGRGPANYVTPRKSPSTKPVRPAFPRAQVLFHGTRADVKVAGDLFVAASPREKP